MRSGCDSECTNNECSKNFPIVDGCPILINEANSVFAINDYITRNVTTMDMRQSDEKKETTIDIVKRLVSCFHSCHIAFGK